MPRATRCLTVSLLATVLPAQTYTTPYGATNAGAGSQNAVPWGWPSPTSVQGEVFFQQIDDGLIGKIAVLRGFTFRHMYSSAVTVPWTYTATIKIGDAATRSPTISLTFANNWKTGSLTTTVLNNGQVNFPAVPAYARPPAPPDAPVPFTVPHINLGTDPLIWELYITSTSPATVKQFHERGMTGGTMTAGVVGVGCTITGGVAAMGSSGSISGTAMTDTLVNGPALAPVVLLMGDEAEKLGGVLPLPFDLGLIGSPGCAVNINALTSFTTTSNASGGALFSLPFTMTPALSGVRLRTQWAAIDGSSLFRTSNGLDHCVPYHASGSPWPQNTVYSSNFGPTPPATAYSNYISGAVTVWSI